MILPFEVFVYLKLDSFPYFYNESMSLFTSYSRHVFLHAISTQILYLVVCCFLTLQWASHLLRKHLSTFSLLLWWNQVRKKHDMLYNKYNCTKAYARLNSTSILESFVKTMFFSKMKVLQIGAFQLLENWPKNPLNWARSKHAFL